MSPSTRPKLGRITLENALGLLDTAPVDHVLYVADPWPWTTGTLVAVAEAELRPVWAAAAVPISLLTGITERNTDLAVREINRRTDPGPFARRPRR